MKKLLFALLLLPSLVWAQSYPLFKPANGILKGQTTTYVTTAAAASDVISLWTGTCSTTTFLRGDGQCVTPSGAGIGTVTSVALAVPSGFNVTGSPITSSGTITIGGTLNVAAGGTGAATLTGLLEGNGTGAIDPAEVADVITLFTGTCNTTTFLRGDGSCQAPPTASFANPTATVGLTAANGVATTAMRSDAAPALNQAIAPTWTGVHTFSNRIALGSSAQFLADNSSGFRVRNQADSSTLFDITNAGAASFPVSLSVAGNSVLTTASSLNASNLSSGTVADARLSSNVALRNVANQNFSVVGNNSLLVSNSSTGFADIQIYTNGLFRMDMCSATTAGTCSTGDASNDSSIRFAQKLILSDNSGANTVATFDTAEINLNATTVKVNGTPIGATGKIAYGSINGTTVTRSLNLGTVTNPSAGVYNVDTTAAGFTAVPICHGTGLIGIGIGVGHTLAGSTATSQLFQVFGTASSTLISTPFEISCVGQ